MSGGKGGTGNLTDLTEAQLMAAMAELEAERLAVRERMRAIDRELARRGAEARLAALAAGLSEADLARLAELRQSVTAEGIAGGERFGELGG